MRIRVGHLYPEYLNIYADRGQHRRARRARRRRAATSSSVTPIGLGDPVPAGIDLFYVGGGQDREQELVAPDLAAKGEALRARGRGRSGVPRRLRRLPAPRPLLPRPRAGPSCPASASCRSTPSPASGG